MHKIKKFKRSPSAAATVLKGTEMKGIRLNYTVFRPLVAFLLIYSPYEAAALNRRKISGPLGKGGGHTLHFNVSKTRPWPDHPPSPCKNYPDYPADPPGEQ